MKRATLMRGWDGERTPVPELPEEPRHATRKDTKRWCRGRVGVEHQYAWQRSRKHDYGRVPPPEPGWYIEACSLCGRQRNWCWSGWNGTRSRKCICGQHTKEREAARNAGGKP